jgi:hypothetical protein
MYLLFYLLTLMNGVLMGPVFTALINFPFIKTLFVMGTAQDRFSGYTLVSTSPSLVRLSNTSVPNL